MMGSWFRYLIFVFLIAGGILSAVAWFQLCSTECAATREFKLFGLPFGPVGIAFFSTALLLHLFNLNFLLTLMMISAVGSEIYFVYLQKAVIGHYCPVCLSVASCILALAFLLIFQKGWTMKKTFSSLTFLVLGFLAAFLGVAQTGNIYANEGKIKANLNLGNPTANMEIYIFTDWYCPACRNLEPNIRQIASQAGEQAKIFFVDIPVHPSSLNYIPYNLAFMTHDKSNYLALRDVLANLAQKTESPTEDDIRNAIAPLGVSLQELNYAEIDATSKLFDQLVKRFDVSGTPAVVIVDAHTQKKQTLKGSDINLQKTEETIKSLSPRS